MAVGWRRASPGASNAIIGSLEHRLGQSLPCRYRDFLVGHDGGEPEDNEFSVPGTGNDSGVNEFLSVAEIEGELRRADLPHGFVPIAFAEGGNLVLVRLDDGAVFFWDHELDDAERMSQIAGDFQSFYDNLQPFDVSKVTLKPGQVKSAWIDPDLLG